MFRDRLAALARAHDALRRDGDTGTTLEAVAREALAPYGAGRAGAGAPRVVVVGPEVRLSSGAAVALGMAFHELATNAAKHGALSVPGGRVRLSWGEAEADADGARWHEVLWNEAGGPPIPEPPSRRGFGTRLLERGLAAQIGGAVALDFAPSGLRCRIRLPADDAQRHGERPGWSPRSVAAEPGKRGAGGPASASAVTCVMRRSGPGRSAMGNEPARAQALALRGDGGRTRGWRACRGAVPQLGMGPLSPASLRFPSARVPCIGLVIRVSMARPTAQASSADL